MPFLPEPSSFTETFVSLNCPGEASRFRWSFQPGMLFQDANCWWKPARRVHTHEGVDFCAYHAGQDGEVRKVGSDLVPSLYCGEVARIDDDFLGKTIWMKHPAIQCDRLILFSALGHIIPNGTAIEGRTVGKGEEMGRIAPARKGALLAMHLHLSVFWAPPFLRSDRLNWQDLPASRMIRLFDPLSILGRGA